MFQKIFLVFLILFALTVNNHCQVLNNSQPELEIQNNQFKCASVAEGFKFCVALPPKSFNQSESISLFVSLQNITEKSISISNDEAFYKLYEVQLFNPDGTKVSSVYEILLEKRKNKSITQEESNQFFNLCCVGSQPFTLSISPTETVKWVINLKSFYKLDRKGEYQLKFGRKVPKLKEQGLYTLWVESIKLLIK